MLSSPKIRINLCIKLFVVYSAKHGDRCLWLAILKVESLVLISNFLSLPINVCFAVLRNHSD